MQNYCFFAIITHSLDKTLRMAFISYNSKGYGNRCHSPRFVL